MQSWHQSNYNWWLHIPHAKHIPLPCNDTVQLTEKLPLDRPSLHWYWSYRDPSGSCGSHAAKSFPHKFLSAVAWRILAEARLDPSFGTPRGSRAARYFEVAKLPVVNSDNELVALICRVPRVMPAVCQEGAETQTELCTWQMQKASFITSCLPIPILSSLGKCSVWDEVPFRPTLSKYVCIRFGMLGCVCMSIPPIHPHISPASKSICH